jgi:putative methionine-R-sulfoxide reductase with GAF domain
VVGNTPYQHVVNQLIRHSTKVAYINNNIPEAKDYLNTSKINEETVLPYKSEIVYPIMPLKRGETDSVMCGFLCVDCDKIEKFDEKRYDVPVIESIIDNLYELLIRIKDTPKNEN